MCEQDTEKLELITRIVRNLCEQKFPGVYWDEIDAAEKRSPTNSNTDQIVAKAAEFRRAQYQRLHEMSLVNLVDEDFLLPSIDDKNSSAKFSFVNRVESEADFSYWSKMPSWSVEEAVALSFGKDPKRVNTHTMLMELWINDFKDNYDKRLELVTRVVPAGVLSEPISPTAFIGWADKVGIQIPNELRLPTSINRAETSVTVSERSSLLKMILGMAVSKYGYQGDAPRNNATGTNRDSIASDLEKSGIGLDPDTIRRYLKEAWGKYGDIVKTK